MVCGAISDQTRGDRSRAEAEASADSESEEIRSDLAGCMAYGQCDGLEYHCKEVGRRGQWRGLGKYLIAFNGSTIAKNW